ncbi:deoxyribodipyrimidine photolyase [Kaistia algarum]|uniref:cryptochrome/photolyase family protein n=1 Tax=Kaistia algarum TaxID=2083279 RepID=UPI000CE7269C|nr:deoxyribodipyrimidine photo-lyase [Kaistia algarum]MCX5514912.1 deoxyribodipyrimidine photo-lyase [Kaistia algarum]PPE79662.1 deoxyribodipyrimidine photolyase [Kaistia algarum]
MTDHPPTSLVWFREDLRLSDNPALTAAIDRGGRLAMVYILDEASDGIRPFGGASRWWLHHSLAALATDLEGQGHRLILRRGPARDIVPSVLRETQADAVFWNRRYGAAERQIDAEMKASFKADGIVAESRQAGLLFEPLMLKTGAGQPYRVFTPFWRACLASPEPRLPLPAPSIWPEPAPAIASDRLDDWGLLPKRPDWAAGFRDLWEPGEAGGQRRLEAFIDEGLPHYADKRDRPDRDVTSRLSPHLRFGEVSPFQLWHAANGAAEHDGIARRNVDKFLAELGWREFSWHLLFHNPDLASRNFQPRFDAFPWAEPDAATLDAWQNGRTGIPIVDAGMRQLWRTGTMHNRVRMIVASFLIKNLLIDWRVGEAWFWDTLVDADPASNAASWQWVAGSGADAAPYFRIFNPLLQAEKFDPAGDYVRAHVEELAALPAARILKLAPAGRPAGYPAPIIDLGASRQRALDAFASIRDSD